MKRFNHKQINESICDTFNLKVYRKGNFDYFYKEDDSGFKNEVGFIEKIGATPNYFPTILVNFFDFETPTKNDVIIEAVLKLYKAQKRIIDSNIQGLNVSLEQRGTTICRATLL